ncbi:Histidinol dehydrogenase, partial [hydrothermal vent metagenome]
MAQWLRTSDTDFESRFADLLTAKREQSIDVANAVDEIIADVRQRGDEALFELTEKFDGFDARKTGLVISRKEIDEGYAACDGKIIEALELAKARVESYHQRQVPVDERYTDAAGVELGHRWTAVEAAGLYVPGGLAAYPSSVLMNAIPARVAGVERLAMVVPTPQGTQNNQVLAAAKIAGVDEIFRIGGAQAIAALAFGTQSIAPVAKIVGPGNAFVAAAKRKVFGVVGIDMIAGPSEVLIISDGKVDPEWTASDLLAQAEHDPVAQSILMTTDEDFARQVEKAIESQLKTLPKAEIAGASWRDYGAIIILNDLDEAVALSDRIAPEHLEIALDEPEALAAKVRNAGAIFLGHYTPEAIGDYVGGPNHVLPTARSARFSSGLNVLDFMKRTTLLKCSAEALRKIGPAAVTLGEAEGLDGHARS